MGKIYFMNIVGFICIATFFIGMFTIAYVSIEDTNNRKSECENNGGEIASGDNIGCFINGSVHKMARVNGDWVVLELSGAKGEQDE